MSCLVENPVHSTDSITTFLPSHCINRHCYQQKDGQWFKGSDRTLENLVQNHEEFLQSNCKRAKVKKMFNVEHEPLIANEAMEKPVVLTVPPPLLCMYSNLGQLTR